MSFFGKYRGRVTDNADPMQQGRIKAEVPDVLGSQASGWAMPCFPAAGGQMGVFALPKIGAGVWIEFEHGNPDFPIWSGAWYGSSSELPSSLLSPPNSQSGMILLCTTGGMSVFLDDTSGTGGITVQTSGGQKITMNSQGITVDSGSGTLTLQTGGGQKITLGSSGIEIDNGSGAKIALQGNKVDVNSGALEVM